MSYKKATLFVDNKKYIYTVKGKKDCIKIIVYLLADKVPCFTAYFSYAEAWGFDVYSPKTIEILIRFYNENSHMFTENEFRTKDYPLLFQVLLDHYFSDSSNEERDKFKEHCSKWYDNWIV